MARAAILLAGLLAAVALAQPPSGVGSGPARLEVSTPAGDAAQSQLDLHWEVVPGALGYEVLRKQGGRWWLNEDDPNCIPMTNSTSITGLAPDTEFEFCVRAVLSKGLSANSQVVKARTAPSSVTAFRPSRPSPPPLPASVSQPPPEKSPSENPTDFLPAPPPRTPPATPHAPAQPKGPPPPTPEGMMGIFNGEGQWRLSWRAVREATGYLVEEEKDGQWSVLDDGVIQENRPSLIVKSHPAPGPYLFRVRAVRGGVRSSPSLPIKVER